MRFSINEYGERNASNRTLERMQVHIENRALWKFKQFSLHQGPWKQNHSLSRGPEYSLPMEWENGELIPRRPEYSLPMEWENGELILQTQLIIAVMIMTYDCWDSGYGSPMEQVQIDAPKPSNKYYTILSDCSFTGSMHPNKVTPIFAFSKKQATVKAAT